MKPAVTDASLDINPSDSKPHDGNDRAVGEPISLPPVIRFRRPVLMDDFASGITDSYETLTLSELRTLEVQSDADSQAQLEELRLALGDFDEADPFEEVDEFEEEWEESVGVEDYLDVEPDGYCEAEECGEEFLDDRH